MLSLFPFTLHHSNFAAAAGPRRRCPVEALEVIGRLDELLERLSEADRENLSFAIRQTVKRITLRRERRGDGNTASRCGAA